MKKSGSIFPERIDSYSQLPLLQENSIHAIASNSLRSAVLKIEETIGEKILDSKIFQRFFSLKERIDNIENECSRTSIKNNLLENNYKDYSVLELTSNGWQVRSSSDSKSNIGILIDGRIILSGTFWIEDSINVVIGQRIDIIDGQLSLCNKKNSYLGTVVSIENNLVQVMLRNTW